MLANSVKSLPEKLLSLKGRLSTLTQVGFSGMINGILVEYLDGFRPCMGSGVVGVLACGLAGYGTQDCALSSV